MAIAEKLNYLLETKNQIKNAIEGKGVSILDTDSFRSYATKIGQIEGGGSTGSTDDWQPEEDWWDIETILANDTENYSQKIICLLTDELDDGAIKNTIKGFEKYKLSDGQVIEQSATTNLDISDLFDKQEDKVCQKGYKTRYIICYTNTTNYISFYVPDNTIYAVFSNLKYSGNPWYSKRHLQGIKLVNNCQRESNSFATSFRYCNSLQFLQGLDTSDTEDFSNMFAYCYSAKRTFILDTSKGKNFNNMYSYCYSLKEVLQMNLINATTLTSMYSSCELLKNIKNIENISVNCTINNSYLNHTSLLKILNALVDLTGQTTQTLTLGRTNLAKLTDEEKAIATEKNWTLA